MNTLRRSAMAASTGLFALFVWAPLAVWFAAPFAVSHAELIALVIPGARRGIVLAETVAFAAVVSAFATAAGGAAALYCWRRRGALARVAERSALLIAPIPPYLHALAWLPLCAALPGRGAGHVTGWISAAWVQALALMPFCFGITRFALAGLDPRTLEAARVYGDDRRMLFRVVLPLLRPALFAAISLALLLTIADHSVPSLFSRSTYSMEVFEEFSATHDASRAMLSATPLVLAGLLALLPLAHFWKSATQRPAATVAGPEPLRLGGVMRYALAAGAGLAVLPVLALFATLMRQGLRPLVWTQSLASGAHDAATSAVVALLSAVIACVPALAVARIVLARPVAGWWLVSAPLAAPSALAGVGLIWMWNRDLPLTPYGTIWMLVLASLARFTPLAVLAVAAWRSRMDPALLDAAHVFAPPAKAFWRVELPLLFPGVAVGAAVVFVLSLGELGATLLVVPPGSGTLALRIYNYLHYGASGSVAALALCLMAGTAAAMLAAARLWRLRA